MPPLKRNLILSTGQNNPGVGKSTCQLRITQYVMTVAVAQHAPMKRGLKHGSRTMRLPYPHSSRPTCPDEEGIETR